MSESNAALSDALIGSRIDGRYSVLGVLGQGGMGVVYDGVHDELGRAVAIKVLTTAWASDRTAVERFLREARTASSFSHGNIVDVSDLGRLPDGRPYLVMPKINGVDLASLLQQVGPQPAKRVGELLLGVAAALDLIHAKGYVHRDIKPENLMYVAREDGSETVMLLDFGIAALLMSNERRLTGHGQIFGTPHYMPPEASTGALPDARGDVYALATVAFELITGALPFDAENLMQLLSMKLVGDAPTLASVTGVEFPPALEAVIARGLAREPSTRYGSAGEFVHAITQATEHAPVSWQTGVLRSTMHSDAHPLSPRHAGYDEQRWEDSDSVRSQPSWPAGASSRPPASRPVSGRPVSAPAPQYSQRPAGRPSSGAPTQYSQRPPERHSSGAPAHYQSGRPGSVGPQRYTSHSSAPASAHYEPPLDAFARTQSSPHTFGARHDSHDSYNPYEPHELGAGLRETERQRRTQSVSASTRWSWLALFVLVGGGAGIGLWQLGKSQSRPDHVAARAVEQAPLAAATPAPAKQPTRELPFVPPVQPSAAATAQAATATDTHAEQVPPPAAAIPNLDQPVQADPPPTAAAPKPATPKPEAAVPPVAPVKPSVRTREPAAVSPQPVPPAPEPVAAPDNAPAQVVTLTQDTPAEPEPAPEPKIPDPPKVGELTSSATAALLRGEVGRAIELLRTATQVDPNHALAWRSLGLAYERSNNPRQALAAYERYLDLVPNGAQSEMVRERMQSLRAQ